MTPKTRLAWRKLVERWNDYSEQADMEYMISRLAGHPQEGEHNARVVFGYLCIILARIHQRAYSHDHVTATLYERTGSSLFLRRGEVANFDKKVLQMFPKMLRPDNNDRDGNYYGLTPRQAKQLLDFLDSEEGRRAFTELGMEMTARAFGVIAK